MSNLVKWGTYDMATAEAEEEDLQKEGKSNFLKLEQGKNVLRVLPPLAGKKSPFRITHQHYIKTPGGVWSFTCPRMEARKPCPVCSLADRLKASGKPADRDKSYEYQARRRVFANVIDRANPDKGPQVMGFGKSIHEELVKLRRDEDDGGDFTHPIKGYDIIIVREGATKNDTKYTVRPARNQSPIADDADLMAEWAGMCPDLDTFARLPSDDDIHEKMAELFGDDDDPPVRTRAQAKPQRAEARSAGYPEDPDDDFPPERSKPTVAQASFIEEADEDDGWD